MRFWPFRLHPRCPSYSTRALSYLDTWTGRERTEARTLQCSRVVGHYGVHVQTKQGLRITWTDAEADPAEVEEKMGTSP